MIVGRMMPIRRGVRVNLIPLLYFGKETQMSRLNTAPVAEPVFTHEGGRAHKLHDATLQLRRLTLASLLWEDTFYVDGKSHAEAVAALVPKVPASDLLNLAIECRSKQNLRHMPLYLVREAARRKDLRGGGSNLAKTIAQVIQRPDELAEFLAIYWKDGREKLASQVKRGLAEAFTKFDEYQLSKWDKDGKIKLRDVLFMVHAKPKDKKQAALWKRLVDGKLKPADTWEKNLSAGEGKKTDEAKAEVWTGMLQEKGKLGAMALLRNLRNMIDTKVEDRVIREALLSASVDRVLPFRFVAAAKYAKRFEQELEALMFRCLEGTPRLNGKTVLLVDVSGSMNDPLSLKSEMNRLDAACGLAMLLREICSVVHVYTFSNTLAEIPARRGFALRDAILSSQPHMGTQTAAAITQMHQYHPRYDRLILITDEQSHDGIVSPAPQSLAYALNVGTYQNGIGYGRWTHIDGWSEKVLDFIREEENLLSKR
jgi:60 kDa SS-A/Ro ribonucleoprotein